MTGGWEPLERSRVAAFRSLAAFCGFMTSRFCWFKIDWTHWLYRVNILDAAQMAGGWEPPWPEDGPKEYWYGEQVRLPSSSLLSLQVLEGP